MTTPEDFKNKMQQLTKDYGHDAEALHSEMDRLMCEVLTEHGYNEGVEIFRDSDIYYC